MTAPINVNLSQLCSSQIGLEISKAELSDAGSYECHLSNDVGKVTGACGVTVHKIFAPPFFSKQLTDVKQAREIHLRGGIHLVWFKGDRLRGTISKFCAIQWDS